MPPIISCPGNILTETDEGMCTTEVSFAEPSFLDNCSKVATITQIEGPSSGSPFPAGDTTVTFEVTDEKW